MHQVCFLLYRKERFALTSISENKSECKKQCYKYKGQENRNENVDKECFNLHFQREFSKKHMERKNCSQQYVKDKPIIRGEKEYEDQRVKKVK